MEIDIIDEAVRETSHTDTSAPSVAPSVARYAVGLTPLLLAACGGGGGGSETPDDVNAARGLSLAPGLTGGGGAEPARVTGLSQCDAARLLTQATFGIRSVEEVEALQAEGVEYWLWRQFSAPAMLHTSYLNLRRTQSDKGKASDEMSYEALWRQWLFEDGQLRARVAFALSQIFVISNVAPNLQPYAMSSYMDMLNRHAFGNYRTLLRDVTVHPAMGYYLNLMHSRKEDSKTGTHPNENYAREVLQLFSIGLIHLNQDGSPKLGSDGKPVPTYDETVVKGFARALSGWSFGGQGNATPELFWKADFRLDINWTSPMLPFAQQHETGPKRLLNGTQLPGNQTPEKDLDAAVDNIFHHPNVGPFIVRQLIQRLVTSNPSPAYIARVAGVFNDNGQGTRGDLRAVIRAILIDTEARGDDAPSRANYGKMREPVIRLANYFRALNASTPSPLGKTDLHYLDWEGAPLGQSPLLAPSVFNYFSPNYRHAGPLAAARLVAPEFQITTESTVVGGFNLFSMVMQGNGYGWTKDAKLTFDRKPWEVLAATPEAFVKKMDVLLFNAQMSDGTRARLIKLMSDMPKNGEWQLQERFKKAFILAAVSPDFVIQK